MEEPDSKDVAVRITLQDNAKENATMNDTAKNKYCEHPIVTEDVGGVLYFECFYCARDIAGIVLKQYPARTVRDTICGRFFVTTDPANTFGMYCLADATGKLIKISRDRIL